ncbi:hypothetical protein PMAYCL1PPCAC_15520, partial [Pristionchus mayeri]
MLTEFHINIHSSPRPNTLHRQTARPNGAANWRALATIGMGSIGASAAFVISGICAYRISKEMSTRVMALGARRLQLQLFRALAAQFLVPFVLCIIPFIFIIFLPLTGLRLGATGTVLGLMVSLFPVIDPIMVIVMIPR